MVNILRDLPQDMKEGRCYIPRERLRERGLQPEELLNPLAMERFRSLYESYLDLAKANLEAGWTYVKMLPRGHARVCLACTWPILIGARTLALLRKANVLDSSRRVSISRSQVRRIILSSVLSYPRGAASDALFRRAIG